MRVIVLAAGRGSRVRGQSAPKPLIEIAGQALIEHQLDVYRSLEMNVTVVVRQSTAEQYSARFADSEIVIDPTAGTGNMVSSLLFGLPQQAEPVIVAYGDIVFESRLLKTLLGTTADISVVVDEEWEPLWQLRMDDPQDDLETLLLKERRIVALGQPTRQLSQVQARYVGLLRFSAKGVTRFRRHVLSAVRQDHRYWCRSMTEVLHDLIQSGQSVQAVPVRRGWLELDTAEDISRYREAHDAGTLANLWRACESR